MKFKYQTLFDEFNLEDCPAEECTEIEIEAFRWSHDPIDNELNFLPNILYDRARKKPPRILQKNQICGFCNISFFLTESKARDKFNYFRSRLEKKHQSFTDSYTHIAKGKIEKNEGKATGIKDEHFGFYEYEGIDFKTKFAIISTL